MNAESPLAEVISKVELLGVRLIKSEVSTLLLNPRNVPPVDMSIATATHVLHREDAGFRVGAALRMRIVRNDVAEDLAEPLALMDVTFELQYALPDAAAFSNEVLEEFARVNGTFNAWPYWREYVQTTAARMTLPPTILPVFRLNRASGPPPREPNAPRGIVPEKAPQAASHPRSRKKK